MPSGATQPGKPFPGLHAGAEGRFQDAPAKGSLLREAPRGRVLTKLLCVNLLLGIPGTS